MIPLGVLASANVPASSGGGETGAEFVTSSNTTTGTTTRTYSGIALGDAAANRNVIIICHSRSQNINSATIAGVTATLHASFTDGVMRTAIFSAVVASGTSGNIVVTHGGNPGGVAIGVYAAYGTLTYSTHATEGNGRIVSLTAPSNALVIVGLSEVAGEPSPPEFGWSMGAIENYAIYNGTTLQSFGGMEQPAAGAWSLELITGLSNYSNHSYIAVAFTLT